MSSPLGDPFALSFFFLSLSSLSISLLAHKHTLLSDAQKHRTIELRLEDLEQDTQCAVCLGEFDVFLLFAFCFFSISIGEIGSLDLLSLSLSFSLSASPNPPPNKNKKKESSARPGLSGPACTASAGPASSAG